MGRGWEVAGDVDDGGGGECLGLVGVGGGDFVWSGR